MTNAPLWRRIALALSVFVTGSIVLLALQFAASMVSRGLVEAAIVGSLVVVVVLAGFVGRAFDRTLALWAALLGASLGYWYFEPQWALISHLMNNVFQDDMRHQQSVGALVGGLRWGVTTLALLSAALGALSQSNNRSSKA
jgi:hypothetical protein